jgi:parallel beta-helix repeat protein
MDRWKRFVDWCQQPSKVKIRTFNPRNIMVIALSILLVSVTASGAWLYQVLSVVETPTVTRDNYEELFPTLIITEDTTLTEDHFGMVIMEADGVTLDGNGHTIIGPGIWMWNSTQRMWDVSTGITVRGRTGVTVKNCRVTNFAGGIWVFRSDGNTLLNNTVYENTWGGISVSFSINNSFLDNTVYSTQDAVAAGFSVEMSFGNIFKGNVAYDNGIGFGLGEFEKEIFEEERGFTPEEYDVNIFEANTARDNTQAGFHIGSLSVNPPFSNVFFHNNLIDNAIQVGVPLGYANSWDDGYPSGGNYWSDYEGVDADGDGIGDMPYVIRSVSLEFDEEGDEPYLVSGEPDGNNVDKYPLMAPFNGLMVY